MQTSTIEEQVRIADGYLIKTILFLQGRRTLTLNDQTYTLADYSSSLNFYKQIAADPELSQQAIDNFITNRTSDQLKPDEAAGKALYIYDQPSINSDHFLLHHFGITEQVQKAIESRAERAAQNWIKRWNRPLGKDEYLEQLGLQSIMFNVFPEKYDRYDIYHRACYLLGQDKTLQARTQATYEQTLREYVLDESLSDFEIKKATAETSPTKIATLKVSSNTLQLLEKALDKLGIKEQAWGAYHKRMEAALRLNPHNTDASIRETLWHQFKPAPYKEADRIKAIWTYYEKGLPKNRVMRVQQMVKEPTQQQIKTNGFQIELSPVTLIDSDLSEEKAYVVEFVAVSLPDDVQNEAHVFAYPADAKACFAFYKDPDKHPAPDTFTALVRKPTGEEVIQSGCRLLEGKYVLSHGKPLFAKDRINRANLTQEDVTHLVNDSFDEFGDMRLVMENEQIKSCILTMGENADGFTVLDYEQETIRKQLESKLLLLTSVECWETGIVYYRLSSRLPQVLFRQLTQAGIVWYHKEEVEEEGDWKGWCSTDLQGLTQALNRAGWKHNRNQSVKSD